jgi:Uma2 family endonuclease
MRLTADDLLDMDVPEHLRGYELVDGELVEVSLPSPPHGRLAARLAHLLLDHVEAHGVRGDVYGEAGYVLGLRHDPERLRGPDVSYVSEATLHAHGGEPARGWFRLAADLMVEIDSPGRKPAVERQRIRDYLEAGVRLIWVIHTNTRSVTVYHGDGSVQRLGTGDTVVGDPVLPGLRLPLIRLFPESS